MMSRRSSRELTSCNLEIVLLMWFAKPSLASCVPWKSCTCTPRCTNVSMMLEISSWRDPSGVVVSSYAFSVAIAVPSCLAAIVVGPLPLLYGVGRQTAEFEPLVPCMDMARRSNRSQNAWTAHVQRAIAPHFPC